MKTNWFKRTLCSILAFVMVLGYVPATAFASEADGLCKHHPQHTTECGYSAAVEAHDCGHVHTDDCYDTVTACIHAHGDCGYVAAVEGHGCDCQPDENGEIVHTEGCGYVEAVAEVLCGHVCSEETGCVTKELNCQHQHDTACGYVEEAVGSPCTFVCQECMSTTNESDSSEYNEDELPVGTGVTWALRGVEQYSSDYLEQCTDNHPTYARVKAIEQTPAYSLPCNPDTNSESVKQATYPIGEILTVTRYLCNTQGNYWLQLEDENWIYAKHVSIVEFCNPFTFADVALEKTEFREGQSNSIRGTLTVDGGADMEVDVKAWYSPVTGSESAKLLCSISDTAQSYDLPTVLPEKVGFDSIPEGQYKFHVSAETERFCPTGFPSDTWNGSSNQDGDWYWNWEKMSETSNHIQFSVGSIICSGSCGAEGNNVTFTLTNDGTLTISGNGAMMDYKYLDRAPWNDSRYQIKSISIGKNVTSIGNWAFYQCLNLTGVTIPGNIIRIGASAFEDCSNLAEVTISDGVTSIGYYAFNGCSSLTSMEIPDSVTSIGNWAFWDCESLTSATIPAGVVENREDLNFEGDGVFAGCTSLTDINIDPDNKYWCSIDGVWFSKDMKTLFAYPAGRSGVFKCPDSVVEIRSGAFDGCNKLTYVELPDCLISIKHRTFYSCSSLTKIDICYCTDRTNEFFVNFVVGFRNCS